MNKRQSGFTLIEIAIVLVIIGLLLGGVLKGQELINNSKIRNTVSSLDGIAAAIYSYQDRYNALPGDDPNADTRWGLAAGLATAGNGVIEGAWGSIDGGTDESALLWEHLRQAGLITGGPAAALATISPPNHSLGGVFGVEDAAIAGADTSIPTGIIICMSNVEAKYGEILDLSLDDGAGDAGDLRNDQDDNPYLVAGGSIYVMCRRI